MTTKSFDDLWIKTHKPNHLASRIEQQAAAGAQIPDVLAERLARLNHLTDIATPLLSSLLGTAVVDGCQVAFVSENCITLSFPTMTAVNHVRYLQEQCLQTLRTHPEFHPFIQIKVVQSPKRREFKASPKEKTPLSQSTKHTITQTANLVITSPKLRDALLTLAQGDDDSSEH